MPVIDEKQWRLYKQKNWRKLWEDLEIGYLDRELLPILIRLNLDRNIYTTSSCSGRIVLSDSTYPWSREETSIVFKKHTLIDINELMNIVNKTTIRRLWINVSGPIIHLSVLKLSYAKVVLKIAQLSGFKHSGIISINKYKGIIIELMSGIKITHLLKTNLCEITNLNKINELVNTLNNALEESRKSLEKLRQNVFKRIPLEEDYYIKEDLVRRGFRFNEK